LSSGPAVKEAHSRVAGLHPAAGGLDASVSDELYGGDMLPDVLVACAGITPKAVATALSVEVVDGQVRDEGGSRLSWYAGG
jgi:hypothetical protein